MYCVTCLGIHIEEVLSGKSYQHLTFGELQLSATNSCPLCAFLLQRISAALRRPLAPGEVLQIFLEQHSSQYRYARLRTPSNADEFQRLNTEDDDFRDAPVGVQSGYESTLIALVGKPEVAPPIGAAIQEKELCYVTLELCTDSGEGEKISKNSFARLVRQDPSDPKCYEMISNWVETCWKTHNCGPATDTQLPTRILEIGRTGESNLRLSISNGRKGRYVALSHCWGKRPTTTTTVKNIAERLNSINLDALPANFRDAVIISRELGYQYLWIDSLCIIQGDRDDWVTESSLMGRVYQNCAIMLAASGSSDSYGGMLNPRAESCALPNRNIFLSPKRKPIQTLEESELGSRAWASQERILAPRIVYYSTEQIFWECRDHRKAEVTTHTLLDTYQNYNKRYHDRVLTNDMFAYNYLDYIGKNATAAEDDEDDEITVRPEGWFWAIQGYSRRHLTNPTDKLPALSGLAQNVFHPQRATGGYYLAGLWSNDILRQLLWENGEDWTANFYEANYIPFSSVRTITKLSRAKVYRAPSWSWVAYDGPIYYDRANDSVVLKQEMDAEQRERSQGFDLKVIEMNMRLASKDPFGQIHEGSNIVVEGICQFVTFRPCQRTRLASGEVECIWNFDIRDMGDLEKEYLCLQVGRRRRKLYSELYQNPEDLAKARLHELGVRCLILEESNGTDGWQRVGIFTFDSAGEADSGWDKKILTLI